MAGCPVTFAIHVNGANSPARRSARVGSSAGAANQPSGTGGSATTGVIQTSWSWKKRAIRRAARCIS